MNQTTNYPYDMNNSTLVQLYLDISVEMLKFAAIFENIMADLAKTEQQFKDVLKECRTLFQKKLHDYGASWRILRPSSLTDQLYIKAKRIRSLEIKKESLVGEGIRPEFIALINYGIVGCLLYTSPSPRDGRINLVCRLLDDICCLILHSTFITFHSSLILMTPKTA